MKLNPTKWLPCLWYLAVFAALSACAPSSPQAQAETCLVDRERESNIGREATATLFDGMPVRIPLNKQRAGFSDEFLAVWVPGNAGRPVVVLTHGPTRNLGSTSITDLAIALNDQGYGTLALQLPVMQKRCEGAETYPQTFPEALARIDAAATWLQAKGIKDTALLGHWIGNVYFGQTDNAPFQSWIVNGLTGNFRDIGDNGDLRILDIYGSEGNKMTTRTAWLRRLWMMFGKNGQQVVIEGAGADFAGKYTQVAQAIDRFLTESSSVR